MKDLQNILLIEDVLKNFTKIYGKLKRSKSTAVPKDSRDKSPKRRPSQAISSIQDTGDSTPFSNVSTVESVSRDAPFLQPQKPEHKGKKTLILDLDETLIHCVYQSHPNAAFTLPLTVGNTEYQMNIIKRPGVHEFLERMCEIYEVVIFTASIIEYAIPVVANLDPKKKIAAVLHRAHCDSQGTNLYKDLSRVGRDLKDIILVDNSARNFKKQQSNGFLITPFKEDMSDRELFKLVRFFEFVSNLLDVRSIHQWYLRYYSGKSFTYIDKNGKEQVFKGRSNSMKTFRTMKTATEIDDTEEGSTNLRGGLVFLSIQTKKSKKVLDAYSISPLRPKRENHRKSTRSKSKSDSQKTLPYPTRLSLFGKKYKKSSMSNSDSSDEDGEFNLDEGEKCPLKGLMVSTDKKNALPASRKSVKLRIA